MKLGIIVQRYGKNISGGAEEHARMLAEHLTEDFDIEILSTCALNYDTWENELGPGLTTVNGISVRRFPTDFCKDKVNFDLQTEKLLNNPHSYVEEIEWLVHQGPYSENLFSFLRKNHRDYTYLIFYTYLYVTTVFGLTIAPQKSFIIPTTHDEPVTRFSAFKPVFHLPRGIFYLTEEEKNFVHSTFHNSYIPHTVLGVGLDQPQNVAGSRFLEKFKVRDPFLLYVGRVDEGKGCKELVDHFFRFIKDEDQTDITLVLAGKKHMPDINHPQVLLPGFISEHDKNDAFQAALAVVSPSRYESLSFLILDAFNFGKPVLANGHSKVVAGHCQKSKGGLIYQDYEQFRTHLKTLLNEPDTRKHYGEKGKQYIDTHFRWQNVVSTFQSLLHEVENTSLHDG